MSKKIIQISENEFLLLRNLILEETGIFLEMNKMYLIENRLSHIVHECGCDNFTLFYFKIKSSPVEYAKYLEKIIESITTKETFWFRNEIDFNFLKDTLFPMFEKILEEGKETITILSAGCSTGQEPYSVAVSILEYFRARYSPEFICDHIKIIAVDISSEAIEFCKKAEYDIHAINRGLSDHHRMTFFEEVHGKHRPIAAVRRMVEFRQFNLIRPLLNFPKFDVIFFRSVGIYFSKEHKTAIFENFSKRLKDNGILILGSGESVQGYTDLFVSIQGKKGMFYKLKRTPENKMMNMDM